MRIKKALFGTHYAHYAVKEENMSEFKEIKTQEEFDAAISSRLQRESKKYEDKIDELNGQITTLNKEKQGLEEKIKNQPQNDEKIEELQSKLKAYETNSVKMRIANELGIPFDMADRLKGDDEESIRKDAELISKFMTKDTYVPPLGDPEGNQNNKDDGYKALLKGLEKGEE